MPVIGELVAYYVTETEVIAGEVIAVKFWDVIDMMLGDGRVLVDVRRVIDGWDSSMVGRFRRTM